MENLTRAQTELHMQKILEVRYTDIELEKTLCLDLLEWCKSNEDEYVSAFANTYLGDYYIAQNDAVHSIDYLEDARQVSKRNGYDVLIVRIYSLLGLYFEMIADEQSSLQHYMEGIGAARKVGDRASEGLILNNIAFNFQRHQGYIQAQQYYQQSYTMLKDIEDSNFPVPGIVLSNLVTVSLSMGNLEEAEAYIRELDRRRGDSVLLGVLYSQNRCQYHAAAENGKDARYWADCILFNAEYKNANKHNAFDMYSLLFDSMIHLKDQSYSMQFLNLLEQCCSSHSLDQQKQLESRYMVYTLTFETDIKEIESHYKRYCLQIRELEEMNNQVIAHGLRATIHLSQVTAQKEQLQTETSNLKEQVNVDELTRVYTRRYFELLMKQFEHNYLEERIGFIMVDVDCLKEFNDTYGHPAGDMLLREVGECLLSHLPEGISPCRFGGDEFICFCIGLTDEVIETYIHTVRDELYNKHIPHRSSRCAQQATLSIGYSNELVTLGLSAQSLFDLADHALYHSKINGRNTYSKQFLQESSYEQ